MRFPRYQWLQEPPNNVCGYCDELAIPDDVNPKFQLISESIDTTSELFDSNPFDEITSTTLEFFIDIPTFSNGVQLYIEDNTYIIEYDITLLSSFYTYTTQGNIYFVKLHVGGIGGAPAVSMRRFLNDIVDVNHGTTSSTFISSGDVYNRIINIPADSYFHTYGIATSVTGTTASVNNGRFFYWDGNNMVFKNIASTVHPTTFHEFQHAIDAGLNSINIPMIVSNPMDIEVTIDDGTNPPTVYPFALVAGQTSVNIPYTALITSTHTIKIEITDTAYRDGLILESFDVTQPQTIDNIQVETCEGVITDIDFEQDYDDLNNYLVEITGVLPSKFRLHITDSDNNVLISRWYKIPDMSDCMPYIAVKWTNNCDFDEIKYTALPFDNHLLLTGVRIKSALDNIESVDGVSTSGNKTLIYRNTQAVYEFRFHPYLEETMDIIERIFDHNMVEIDGKGYTATEPFKTSEIDMSIYTGTIELSLNNSGIINSKCCC